MSAATVFAVAHPKQNAPASVRNSHKATGARPSDGLVARRGESALAGSSLAYAPTPTNSVRLGEAKYCDWVPPRPLHNSDAEKQLLAAALSGYLPAGTHTLFLRLVIDFHVQGCAFSETSLVFVPGTIIKNNHLFSAREPQGIDLLCFLTFIILFRRKPDTIENYTLVFSVALPAFSPGGFRRACELTSRATLPSRFRLCLQLPWSRGERLEPSACCLLRGLTRQRRAARVQRRSTRKGQRCVYLQYL